MELILNRKGAAAKMVRYPPSSRIYRFHRIPKNKSCLQAAMAGFSPLFLWQTILSAVYIALQR